jgi:hypothetical protein
MSDVTTINDEPPEPLTSPKDTAPSCWLLYKRMSSSFSTRNTYYLRISRDTVLSLYAYIEEPYVGWMSDYILQVRAHCSLLPQTDIADPFGWSTENPYFDQALVCSSLWLFKTWEEADQVEPLGVAFQDPTQARSRGHGGQKDVERA